jgi:hypothetical protein
MPFRLRRPTLLQAFGVVALPRRVWLAARA